MATRYQVINTDIQPIKPNKIQEFIIKTWKPLPNALFTASQIHSLTGYSKRSIKRAIKQLEKQNIIELNTKYSND